MASTVCVCARALVAQLCLTFCNPLDCRLPSSSVHGILQARMLEWIAIPFSRASSWPRDGTQVSCITSKLFSVWGSTIEEIKTKCYWAPKSSWVKLPSQRRAQFEGKSTAEKNGLMQLALPSFLKPCPLSLHSNSQHWLVELNLFPGLQLSSM